MQGQNHMSSSSGFTVDNMRMINSQQNNSNNGNNKIRRYNLYDLFDN